MSDLHSWLNGPRGADIPNDIKARIREQRALLNECERHLEWVIAEGNGSINTKKLYAKLRQAQEKDNE